MFVDLREEPVTVGEAIDRVAHAGAGAVDLFVGYVRDHSEGKAVVRLEYSAYGAMARAELARIAGEVEASFPGSRVAAIHRVGSLVVGDVAVVCAASAPHRAAAFEACRALIERIKASVPIWKREHGPDGATWVGFTP